MSEECLCPLCGRPTVTVIYPYAKGRRMECLHCCHKWTEPQPWRALPITPQQAAWLAARGLESDGTRGHAADLIGDRIPWRKEPPTAAQVAWFAERELLLPKLAGMAAWTMLGEQKRPKGESC